ncbi:SOCS box domain [Trinorchestia longiramus]|nr:SOCS box domain [Trinorchestia longiramus]
MLPSNCSKNVKNVVGDQVAPENSSNSATFSRPGGNPSENRSPQNVAVGIPHRAPVSPNSTDIPNKQLKALLCSDVIGLPKRSSSNVHTSSDGLSVRSGNPTLHGKRTLGGINVPPAKRHCTGLSRMLCGRSASRCLHLKSPLSCPASPLSSSYLSRFSSSFSSSQLSPSASKLPLATINKRPPPPAPSLVQPQPLCNTLCESHFYPTSSRSLFEKLYCASTTNNTSRDSLGAPKNIPSSQDHSPSSTSEVSSTTNPPGEQDRSTSEVSATSFTNSRKSSAPVLPLSFSMPSLASLLSSSANNPRFYRSQSVSLNSDTVAAEAPKLPDFRNSFSAAGVRRVPTDNQRTSGKTLFDEDIQEVSSTTGEDDDSKLLNQVRSPFSVGGTPCQLPFVGKNPKFTTKFLRTLTFLLCKQCLEDGRTGDIVQCRRCHDKPLHSLFVSYERLENSPNDIEKCPPTSLHVACLLSDPCPALRALLGSGCSPNHPNLLGQTALHSIMLGEARRAGFLDALSILLESGASPLECDNAGATPLLYVKILLKEGLYSIAAAVAEKLLKAGASVDAANDQGRTLLSYSLCCGDRALALTRVLLNHGANIWGNPHRDWDHSAFLYIFKTAMLCHSVSSLTVTLSLVCRLMSAHPSRMRSHLQRNVTRHGRCHAVFSGVSCELLRFMEPYYKKPQSLSSLAGLTVRASLPAATNIATSVTKLPLPPKIKRQLALLE